MPPFSTGGQLLPIVCVATSFLSNLPSAKVYMMLQNACTQSQHYCSVNQCAMTTNPSSARCFLQAYSSQKRKRQLFYYSICANLRKRIIRCSRLRKVKISGEGWGTAPTVSVSTSLQQVNIVVILLLRLFTQKAHRVVYCFQRFFLQMGLTCSPPPLGSFVGCPAHTAATSRQPKALEVVVAAATGTLRLDLHELLFDFVGFMDLMSASLADSIGLTQRVSVLDGRLLWLFLLDWWGIAGGFWFGRAFAAELRPSWLPASSLFEQKYFFGDELMPFFDVFAASFLFLHEYISQIADKLDIILLWMGEFGFQKGLDSLLEVHLWLIFLHGQGCPLLNAQTLSPLHFSSPQIAQTPRCYYLRLLDFQRWLSCTLPSLGRKCFS